LSLSYTTCFGLHGHLQTDKQQDKASRQTHTKETAKLTKENSTGKTNGNVQSVTTCKKRQKASEADSFRNIKVKISYTTEDGHVGRNM
jgi:hypothetical protein